MKNETNGADSLDSAELKPRKTPLALRAREVFNRTCGIPIEADLTPYDGALLAIHAFRKDAGLDDIPDEGLARMFHDLRTRVEPTGLARKKRRRDRRTRSGIPDCENIPDSRLVIEAFGLVFEAARRTLGLITHDAQLIAGLAMCGPRVAELPTGEGKTLAAVFPACLSALSGRGIHILTFNDYLARRDAAWMGPVYRLLGLSVGFIQEGMDKPAKRRAYACDVTYATAKEAGFDFLRDELVYDAADRVHRPFHMAIVDEADSILIDEARIPLVISGLAGTLDQDAGGLAGLIRFLVPGRDFITDEAKTSVSLTDAGLEKFERLLGRGNLYAAENERLLAAVHCALHAEALLCRDKDYIIRDGRVEIVDEFTGRVMDQRHWPDGLQAAVEAKEHVLRKSEERILGSITLQHYFRLYPKLCGMTATARPSAAEFKEFYGLSVTVVPPDRPCVRLDFPDAVFTHKEAKTAGLVREIAALHASGRPILVGTLSVGESEELAAALKGSGVACEVLNARNDELEAGIIARAGQAGAVTISTNMAGRGTDIKLSGPDEADRERIVGLGGLYVIGTNRHESLRIDQQLRGRAGRQGDPGTSRFFISLDDDIFDRYGLRRAIVARHHIMPQRGELENSAIRREIIHAQRVIEGQNFDTRKSLWSFSVMIETQRRIVEAWRRSLIDPGGSEAEAWLGTLDPELEAKGCLRFGRDDFETLKRRATLFYIDRCWADHLAWLTDVREGIHLVSLGGRDPAAEFMKSATEAFDGIEERIDQSVAAGLAALIDRDGPVDLDAEGLKGPSSTWTYLVNEDQFGWGIELLKGKNIGFTASAAALYGPLYIFTLLVNRLRGKKRSD